MHTIFRIILADVLALVYHSIWSNLTLLRALMGNRPNLYFVIYLSLIVLKGYENQHSYFQSTKLLRGYMSIVTKHYPILHKNS